MKKLDLGQTMNTLANIGVIAGIIFLAYELRQNNVYLAEESRYSQLQNRIEFNRDLLMNPLVVAAYYRTDDPEEIRALQRIAAGRRALLQWQWNFESPFWATQESIEPRIQSYRDVYRSTSVHEAWEAESHTYSPSFVRFMEENVINSESQQ